MAGCFAGLQTEPQFLCPFLDGDERGEDLTVGMEVGEKEWREELEREDGRESVAGM